LRWTVLKSFFSGASAPYANRSTPDPPADSNRMPIPPPDDSPDGELLGDAPSSSRSRGRQADQARALAEAERVRARAVPVEEQLKTLREALARWNTRVAPLLNNESGRRLATSQEALARMALVAESQQPEVLARQVEHWQSGLDQLLNPVANYDGDEPAAAAGSHLKLLDTLSVEINHAAQALKNDLAEVERLVAETKALVPAAVSLSEALTTHRAEAARVLNEKIAETRRKTREEGEERLRQTVEEAERAKFAAEIQVQEQRIVNERLALEKNLAELQEEGEEALRAQARIALLGELKAELTEVNSLLRPFITPALMEIGGRGFQRVGNPVPMSLGKIQGFGALEASDQGLERLHYLGGSTDNWRQDRGGFPQYKEKLIQRDASVRRTVERAQQFLKKYGAALVDKGYLRP